MHEAIGYTLEELEIPTTKPRALTLRNVRTLLTYVKRFYDHERMWCKFDFAQDRSGEYTSIWSYNAYAFPIDGAVHKMRTEYNLEYLDEILALKIILLSIGKITPNMLSNIALNHGAVSIPKWNDHELVTFEHILEAISTALYMVDELERM